MVAVKHPFVSPAADGADPTKLRASDWNAGHTIDWGLVGDMIAEAIASTAAAGASGKVADAAHRHAMPSAGLAGDIGVETFGASALAGVTGKIADAGHIHAMPASPTSTNPVVYLAPGSATSNDAAALAAGSALIAAVAALPTSFPNPGGVIQLGRGFYTLPASASALVFNALSFIEIRGIGGVSGGSASGTVIESYYTGSGSIITLAGSQNIRFRDLHIRYQSSSFTGSMIDMTTALGAECDSPQFRNVQLQGVNAAGQTATLLNCNTGVSVALDKVNFSGGGVHIRGRKHFAISAVSIANPTVLTVTAHGMSTGEYVWIGGTGTTPSINTVRGYSVPITVIDADHFSVAYNVSAVADGTGTCTNSSRSYVNIATFQDCLFINAAVMAVMDPDKAWVFLNPTVQSLRDGSARWLDHSEGNWAQGFTLSGGWFGDNTTSGQTENWLRHAGQGFQVSGVDFGASGSNTNCPIRFDGLGVLGWQIAGNQFNGFSRFLDFQALGNDGIWIGNTNTSDVGTWAAFTGTVPPGKYVGGVSGATRPSAFLAAPFGAAAGVDFWDADIATQLYRASAGIMKWDASLQLAGTLEVGVGTAKRTVLRASTAAGVTTGGSDTIVELLLDGKGTSPDVGGVRVGTWAKNGGTFQAVRGISYSGIISPTNLSANTDNWAPTDLMSAYLIRVGLSAAWNLTGIVAPLNNLIGQTFWLYNISAFTLTLKHDVTSTAANRFFCPNKVDYALLQGSSVQLIYSATDSRWLVLAGGA